MWCDYEADYRDSLQDPAFLAWRELGARRKAENILRVCSEIARPASIVEIGCGTGSVIRALHAMNFAQEYCCIDLSPSAVTFARNSSPAFTDRALAGRADALPFSAGAFDLAILSHVIEHLDDPISALSEAARVAHYIVVEVPTEKVLSNFVRTKVLRRPYPSIAGAGHVQFWSPSSIVSFLERDAHFEIVNRYQDLLDGEIDQGHSTRRDSRALLKGGLRNFLPAVVYSRLLTTHYTFLCRKNTVLVG